MTHLSRFFQLSPNNFVQFQGRGPNDIHSFTSNTCYKLQLYLPALFGLFIWQFFLVNEKVVINVQ